MRLRRYGSYRHVNRRSNDADTGSCTRDVEVRQRCGDSQFVSRSYHASLSHRAYWPGTGRSHAAGCNARFWRWNHSADPESHVDRRLAGRQRYSDSVGAL
jgi:hypothetical protein